MKELEYIIKTDRYNIDFINKIVEAYEGLAVLRTLDKYEARIKLLTNYCFENDIDSLLKKLKKYEINYEIIEKREWEGVI